MIHHQKQRLRVDTRAGSGVFLAVLVFLAILVCCCGVQAQEPVSGAGTVAVESSVQQADVSRFLDREKGLRAMGDGIYSAAARFFLAYREACGQTEPELADATVLLVKACLHQDHVEEAQAALEYHQQHSPGVQDQYYRDGLTYWRSAVLLRQGKPADAVAQVRSLTAESQTPEYRNLALELLADAYVRLKQWGPAEAVLRKQLEEFPDAPNAVRAYLGLIRVYLATGRGDRAADILAKLEQRKIPAPSLILRLFGVLAHLQNKQLDTAFSLYESIAGERPQRADTDWWMTASRLVDALLEAQRHEEALLVLPQAMVFAGSEDERAQCALRTVEALIALGKVELAINALETFKKNYPRRPEIVPVQISLAELLRQTKNYMTAAGYFEEVAEDDAAPGELRFRAALSRGWCFREGGQYERAVQALSRAAELGQTAEQKAEALFLAGDTAFGIKDFTIAALRYQAVADNYPNTARAEEARLRQARSRAQAKLYDSAAQAYEQFKRDFPDSDSYEDACLELGIALKNWGQYARAMTELSTFAAKYPTSKHAPRALMEAHEAAMGANSAAQAIQLLSTVIAEYPKSEFLPHAIYQRGRVYFYRAEYDNAVADCELFLQRFPLLPMAADILMWLGDHYANKGNLVRSEEYFLKLVTTHPRAEIAPVAHYEAAKSAYKRDNLSGVLLLLKEFEEKFIGRDANGASEHPTATARTRAQVQMLHGDVLAKQGKYAEALSCFAKARELAADSPLGLAALGRRGEMFYSLGTDEPDNLALASECFQTIVENQAAPPELRELARYRLAKCYEKLGENEKALDQYLNIVYQYEHEHLQYGRVRDWYYYARSGYDAANLLVMTNRYRQAARLYERLHDKLSKARVPTAADALQKAQEIRETHGLDE